MRIKKFCVLVPALIVVVIMIGCSAAEEGDRSSKSKEIIDTTAAIVTKDVNKTIKENQPVGIKDSLNVSTAIDEKNLFFSVQLGAFKEIKNVENFEKTVKKDFPDLFIKTEMNPADQTYKVTAGKFEKKDDAYKLRDYCIEKGYKDSWVVAIPK